MSSMPTGCFRLQGLVYRAHNPRWAHSPESGEGARRHGGRWNRPGQAALYTSARFETAWLEAQQGFPYKTQPLTLCTYEVDCQPILDLTNPSILEQYRIHPADLACAWLSDWHQGRTPASWTIADSLIEKGIAGIRVTSQAIGATADDINIIFWHWSRTLPHRVRVIDDEGRLRSS